MMAEVNQLRQEVAAQERRWRLVTSTKDTGALDQSALFHDILSNLFSEEDLRTLCFEMNVSYDHLPGSTQLGKARELIIYCDNRGMLKKLFDKVKSERPYVFAKDD